MMLPACAIYLPGENGVQMDAKTTYSPKHVVAILRRLAVEKQLQDYVRPGDGYQGKHRKP